MIQLEDPSAIDDSIQTLHSHLENSNKSPHANSLNNSAMLKVAQFKAD